MKLELKTKNSNNRISINDITTIILGEDITNCKLSYIHEYRKDFIFYK